MDLCARRDSHGDTRIDDPRPIRPIRVVFRSRPYQMAVHFEMVSMSPVMDESLGQL
jgi:hypothetical protein